MDVFKRTHSNIPLNLPSKGDLVTDFEPNVSARLYRVLVARICHFERSREIASCFIILLFTLIPSPSPPEASGEKGV